MFRPSTVMLIALWGRPLTIESRLPPDVCTPGRNVMKSTTLRLVSGRLMIWFVLIVDDTVADCVWMISPPPWTVTVSERPPTCRMARTDAGLPALTSTSVSTIVLKPCRLIVTEYLPTGRAGTVKVPCSDVVASYVVAVALFFTTTVAPGIVPPDASTTTPAREEVALCAKAGAPASATTSAKHVSLNNLCIIGSICSGWRPALALRRTLLRPVYTMYRQRFCVFPPGQSTPNL